MSEPHWAKRAAERDALILRTFDECPEWYTEKVLLRQREAFGDCLIWQRSVVSGYGQVALPSAVAPRENGGVVARVHRVTYLKVHGSIPYGLTLDHLCRTPACGNVDHLEPATDRVNILRSNGASARHARATHCSRGHLLEEGNLVAAEVARGWRDCLTCSLWRKSTIMDAARTLGISKAAYTATYGHSLATALEILADRERQAG